jgi:hypothetical protein
VEKVLLQERVLQLVNQALHLVKVLLLVQKSYHKKKTSKKPL